MKQTLKGALIGATLVAFGPSIVKSGLRAWDLDAKTKHLLLSSYETGWASNYEIDGEKIRVQMLEEKGASLTGINRGYRLCITLNNIKMFSESWGADGVGKKW